MFQFVNKYCFLLFVISCLCCIAFAQTTKVQKQTLALLQLSAQGVSDAQVRQLGDALRTGLSNAGSFDLLQYSQIEIQLKEQGAEDILVCNQTMCAVQAGQLLGVDFVAIGSVGLIGQSYSMNVRVIEVATSRVKIDVDEYYKGKEENLQSELTPVVVAKLSGTPVPKSVAKKNPIVKVLLTGSALVVGIPVGYLVYKKYTSEEEQIPMTEVNVQWN